MVCARFHHVRIHKPRSYLRWLQFQFSPFGNKYASLTFDPHCPPPNPGGGGCVGVGWELCQIIWFSRISLGPWTRSQYNWFPFSMFFCPGSLLISLWQLSRSKCQIVSQQTRWRSFSTNKKTGDSSKRIPKQNCDIQSKYGFKNSSKYPTIWVHNPPNS